MTVALTTVSQLAGFLFAMGVAQSLSYFIARRPQAGPSLLTTWLLMLIPLAAVAIAISELLLPDIFPTDAEQAIEIGRWFLFTIVAGRGARAELRAAARARTTSSPTTSLRLVQPTLMAAGFLVLWPLDALTVRAP